MKHKSTSKTIFRIAILILSAGINCQIALGQTIKHLSLPSLFSDNMVLQRDINASIWGNTDPGNIVTIEFNNIKTEVKADLGGKWLAKLPSQAAGGPYELIVSNGNQSITYKNVMFGDVWIASGQSNMEAALNWRTNNKEIEIANANYTNIRLFSVPKSVCENPVEDLQGGNWLTCTPENVASFSAVGYFFGREIHLAKNVPVGIIQSGWGGTRAEAWTSYEMLGSLPDFKNKVSEIKADTRTYQDQYPKNRILEMRWDSIAKKSANGLTLGVNHFEYDASSWKTIVNPKSWKDCDLGKYTGFVWFQKTIELPKNCDNKALLLSLGTVWYSDICYFNGVEIGRCTNPYIHRQYTIPANLVKPGKNVIAVRVLSEWSIGGFNGPTNELFIKGTSKGHDFSIPLNNEWKYNENIEPHFPEVISFTDNPAALYNTMIAPIQKYGIKGVIWYQGESNTDNPRQYRTLLPALISDWRIHWEQGYFPFLIVQLANYGDRENQPVESDWAELREAQLLASQNNPNVGLAVAIDIGEGLDIHPGNKQDVGKRLALSALKLAYHDTLVYSGPIYKSMEISGDKITLKFDQVGTGLKIRDNETLKGFSIAGKDKKFHLASGEIKGNTVILHSDQEHQPVSVRYGWDDNPECNLYNVEGLPASPFRTDNW
jgi:sialate O-acetylesterase